MRVVIDHKSGSKVGNREIFARESLIIGRGRANDVILDPFLDPTVSAQHAEIRFEEDTFILYDMGSLNGTYLNGNHVRRATLHDGDEIGLGAEGPKLNFRVEGQGKLKPTSGFGRTVKQFNLGSGPRTSNEFEVPRLNESVTTNKFWIYVLGVLVTVGVAVLAWWAFYG